MSVQLPPIKPDIAADIAGVAQVDQVDWAGLEAIVLAESGGDPNAGKGTGHIGLLQLSTDYGSGMPSSDFAGSPAMIGGRGYQGPYSESQLLDPATNLYIGTSPIAAAYQQGKQMGLSGAALVNYAALHSGHDSWTGTPTGNNPNLIPTIDAYYKALQGQPVPGQSGPGNIPVAGGIINGTQAVVNKVQDAANLLSDPAGAAGQIGDALASWIQGNGWKIILALIAVVIVFGAGRKLLAGVGA